MSASERALLGLAALERSYASLRAISRFRALLRASHARFATIAHLMNIVQFSASMRTIASLRGVSTRDVVRHRTSQHATGRRYLPLLDAVRLCMSPSPHARLHTSSRDSFV